MDKKSFWENSLYKKIFFVLGATVLFFSSNGYLLYTFYAFLVFVFIAFGIPKIKKWHDNLED